jgi:hypothetical protein
LPAAVANGLKPTWVLSSGIPFHFWSPDYGTRKNRPWNVQEGKHGNKGVEAGSYRNQNGRIKIPAQRQSKN